MHSQKFSLHCNGTLNGEIRVVTNFVVIIVKNTTWKTLKESKRQNNYFIGATLIANTSGHTPAPYGSGADLGGGYWVANQLFFGEANKAKTIVNIMGEIKAKHPGRYFILIFTLWHCSVGFLVYRFSIWLQFSNCRILETSLIDSTSYPHSLEKSCIHPCRHFSTNISFWCRYSLGFTEFVGLIPQSLVLRSNVLGWLLIYRNWSISE